MPVISRLDCRQFRVNFEGLKRSLLGWRQRLQFSSNMLQIDPQLILESIRRVMTYCDLHDGIGQPLVWNEYKVFLSREDHEEFVHMEPVLLAQADGLLDGYRKALEAETIGDLTLRLLVDDAMELPRRVGVVQVATKINRDLDAQQPELGEITVRLTPPPAAVYPVIDPAIHTAATPRTASSDDAGFSEISSIDTSHETHRVPPGADTLALKWDHGAAAIRPGVRWIVGRATDPPIAEHSIQLPDASTRISSRAFWIEAKAEGATIGRFDHETANAVQVKGELLMRGGEIWVYEFPAAILLTHGELELSLERP
jgi:hypothetical protein